MNELATYIMDHTERGTCQCGSCADAPGAIFGPPKSTAFQPSGHTADLIFFKIVARNDPKAEDLTRLINENKGEFCEVNLFDGNEHNYIELGGWIGSQQVALLLMGLGSLLGMWTLITPAMLPGIDEKMQMQMAQGGFLAIIHKLQKGVTPNERIDAETKAETKAASA